MTAFKEIYKTLKHAYGPQGWWPTTPSGQTKPEYLGGPSNQQQRLEVMFGAILTQNTSWKNVEKALAQLSKHNLIDVKKVLALPRHKLASLIRSSGYFNEKAKKLKNLCEALEEQSIPQLRKMRLPKLRSQLLGIKGVGPETADSILLYAFEKPVFVIDAYTKRIFSRLGFVSADVTYSELQDLFHSQLPRNSQVYNEYHALLVQHTKVSCRKKPVCESCVLREMCISCRSETLSS